MRFIFTQSLHIKSNLFQLHNIRESLKFIMENVPKVRVRDKLDCTTLSLVPDFRDLCHHHLRFFPFSYHYYQK
jgi:hypothetical protein